MAPASRARGAAKAPPGPAGDTQWITASAEVRSTAKWVVTALAGVAAVVFGAGPLITAPSLDVEDDRCQLLLAFGLGVMGLLGIGALIVAVSKVMLPVESSLDDLPQSLLDQIDALPQSFLPGTEPDLASFRRTLAALRTSVVEIPGKIADLEGQAQAAQKAGDSAAYHARVADAEAFTRALKDNTASLTTYESVRTDLIDRGAYTKLSGVFSEQKCLLWLGAFMAGVGGLGFQLALSTSGEPEPAADGTIAIISPSVAAQTFWESYGLADCETSTGQAPVLITAGDGSSGSPYQVQTLPTTIGPDSECPAMTFTAHADAFTVVVPTLDKVTIDIE